MKKLGLIGGVGPESTIPYYREIVYGVQQAVQKAYFPPMTIESLSSFEVIRMSSQGDTEGLTAYFLEGIQNLVKAGAEVGALACNTGHMVFDELQRQSPISLISIVETTCSEAADRKLKRLGLIGTAATMEGQFFRDPFEKAGMDIIVPGPAERDYIADRILKELELGIVKEDTARRFIEIAETMVQTQHAEAIVLGCTELPLLFEGRQLSVPVLDTMELHIQALVRAILEE